MSGWTAYDPAYDPPAPVIPVRIADPQGELAVLVPGLIDTGADCSLIPAAIAHGLRLPAVDRLEIRGVGGGGGAAQVYAAHVEIGGARVLARLAAYEEDVIVGRDVLNRVMALLDGPRLRLRLSAAWVISTRNWVRIPLSACGQRAPRTHLLSCGASWGQPEPTSRSS